MTTEIQTASDSAIARAARLAWTTDGKDGEPEIPTERDLAEWIDQIPRKYLEDADGKLLEMMRKVAEPLDVVDDGFALPVSESVWTASDGELQASVVYGVSPIPIETLDFDPDQVFVASREEVDDDDPMFVMLKKMLTTKVSAQVYLVDLLPLLTRLAVERETYAWTLTDSPLVHLARAWQDRPAIVRPNRRPDPILPSRLAQVDSTDKRAGRLFGFAAHTKDGQLVLPGFSEGVTPRSPALPLELYDLGLGPKQTPGRGAPLALRLFVSSVLAVPERQRREGTRVVYRFTLKDLMGRLWPGKRLYPAQQWPGLMQAIELVDRTRIPWYDPETGHGGMRRVVGFDDVPRSPHHMEDLVSIAVNLPPGSQVGPPVGPSLAQLGVTSAAAYRLYINLAYLTFEPGRTHMPVRERGREYWVMVDEPDRYNHLTLDDVVDLAFPTSSRKRRRNLRQEADEALKRLVERGDFRIVDGKILPAKELPDVPQDKQPYDKGGLIL